MYQKASENGAKLVYNWCINSDICQPPFEKLISISFAPYRYTHLRVVDHFPQSKAETLGCGNALISQGEM